MPALVLFADEIMQVHVRRALGLPQKVLGSAAAANSRRGSSIRRAGLRHRESSSNGAPSRAIESIGRSRAGSTPRRGFNCSVNRGVQIAPHGPSDILSRSSTASSMVGYIDSSTTALNPSGFFASTIEAAPSDTPIAPMRSSGNCTVQVLRRRDDVPRLEIPYGDVLARALAVRLEIDRRHRITERVQGTARAGPSWSDPIPYRETAAPRPSPAIPREYHP